MFDRAAANLEMRTYLRQRVADLVYDDTTAILTENLLDSVPRTPALCIAIRLADASEEVPGIKTQRVQIDVIAALITGSVAPGVGAPQRGARGSDMLMSQIIKGLHWYPKGAPAGLGLWLFETLRFRHELDTIIQGKRHLDQAIFRGSIRETWI